MSDLDREETVWPAYELPYRRVADDLGVTMATVRVWQLAGGAFRFRPQSGWSWYWRLHLN